MRPIKDTYAESVPISLLHMKKIKPVPSKNLSQSISSFIVLFGVGFIVWKSDFNWSYL